MIEDIIQMSRVYLGDLDLISINSIPMGKSTFNNICVHKFTNTALSVQSSSGPDTCFQLLVSPRDEDLWKEKSEKSVNVTQSKTKPFGLQENETSLVSLLPVDLLENINGDNGDLQDNEDYYSDLNWLPDLAITDSILNSLLYNKDFNLIMDILTSLKKNNAMKWERYNDVHTLPSILSDAKKLVYICTKEELDLIGQILKNYTGRDFFIAKLLKISNANMIASAFTGVTINAEVSTTSKYNTSLPNDPMSLKDIAKACINSTKYPVKVLQVALSRMTLICKYKEWLNKSRVPMEMIVPTEMAGKGITSTKCFSYPEYSEHHKQVEPRTCDYSHILTNMRGHICRHGYEFCKREHYLDLCSKRPDILSRSAVEDHIDPQNVFTAVNFFSLEVEDFMRNKQFNQTADFIKITWDWFNACNE